MGDPLNGRRDLFLTLTPPRLAFMASMFTFEGAKKMNRNLQPRLVDLLYQGQFLHHTVSFLQDKENDRPKELQSHLVTTLRCLSGEKSIQAWGRALCSSRVLKPLKVFAFDSISKQAARGEESKLRIWATWGSLVYQIGHERGIFTQLEDTLVNPLNSKVVARLLLDDTDTDGNPFANLFGRCGLLYIANKVGSAAMCVLDNFLRDISTQMIATPEVMALARNRVNVDFNSLEQLELHLRSLVEYDREERRRACLNQGGQRQEVLDRLAFLTLFEVCIFGGVPWTEKNTFSLREAHTWPMQTRSWTARICRHIR